MIERTIRGWKLPMPHKPTMPALHMIKPSHACFDHFGCFSRLP